MYRRLNAIGKQNKNIMCVCVCVFTVYVNRAYTRCYINVGNLLGLRSVYEYMRSHNILMRRITAVHALYIPFFFQ